MSCYADPLQQLSMQQNQGQAADCQLCLKQQQISELKRRRKRDLSLQSIYRKDFHSLLDGANQVRLQVPSKNESTNLAFRGKSYLDFNSTYLASFNSKKGDPTHRARAQQTIPNPEKMPQNFVSTYNYNHHLLPLGHKQEAYRIADFQFYNIRTPFAQATEYKKHFRNQPRKKQMEESPRHLPELPKTEIRVFDTTQKAAFRGDRSVDKNPAILPIGTMGTLPTSPFLYNSTYNQEFAPSGIHQASQSHEHVRQGHNGRKPRMVKNYYF